MTPKVPYGLGGRPFPTGVVLTSLPFYAILRSIPDKTLGILAMAAALLLLPLLPLEQRLVGVGGLHPAALLGWRERPTLAAAALDRHRQWVGLLAVTFLLLGFIGSQPVAEPFLSGGQLLMGVYFGLLLLLPLSGLQFLRRCSSS